MDSKRCVECGRFKMATRENFEPDAGMVGGLNDECRGCTGVPYQGNQDKADHEAAQPTSARADMKNCKECGAPKAINRDNFHRHAAFPDGWDNRCKECRNKMKKAERAEKNGAASESPEERIARIKARQKALATKKEEATAPCSNCAKPTPVAELKWGTCPECKAARKAGDAKGATKKVAKKVVRRAAKKVVERKAAAKTRSPRASSTVKPAGKLTPTFPVESESDKLIREIRDVQQIVKNGRVLLYQKARKLVDLLERGK